VSISTLAVTVVGTTITKKSPAEARVLARALLDLQVPVKMEWVSICGECDAEKAQRLANRAEAAENALGKAEEEIAHLRRQLVTCRKRKRARKAEGKAK